MPARALKEGLRAAASVTDAIYEAGFGSGSRVYERVDTRLGMTPRQYRKRGAGVAMSWAAATTALGPLMMAATDRGLCFVQFGRTRQRSRRARTRVSAATLSPLREEQRETFGQWMHALWRTWPSRPRTFSSLSTCAARRSR